MKRKMRFNFLIMTVIVTAGILTGCGVTYPDITQEEEDHVVEYAVGLLLKYDKEHEHSLVELKEEEPEPEKTPSAPEPESLPETVDPAEDIQEQPDMVDMTRPETLTEIMGIEGIEFNYVGCETADEYPADVNADEVYLVVNATPDYKLLILNFDVTNNSGSDFYLDMGARNARFKVGWNGGESQNALITMLMNDMSSYQGQLAAGQTVQLVVIGEVPAEIADSIQNVTFLVKDSEGINTTDL